ncbi:small nuclear ribonucleoprotein E [Kipferlia bialata]|uniref:Small nuclear ribonucleoprotein E n=1 Tax=Kipferlia bialata TaxID=797122 RepID=A0A9K3D971_9EUKA|nr:small nuclear ribonucleoprotein E [Kipferlia bialata]|eukprot:g13358.t1
MAPKGKNRYQNFYPIVQLYRFLEERARIQIWLHDDNKMRIEGELRGFDEFFNLTLINAQEVAVKSGEKTEIGTIILKGENICLFHKTEDH